MLEFIKVFVNLLVNLQLELPVPLSAKKQGLFTGNITFYSNGNCISKNILCDLGSLCRCVCSADSLVAM